MLAYSARGIRPLGRTHRARLPRRRGAGRPRARRRARPHARRAEGRGRPGRGRGGRLVRRRARADARRDGSADRHRRRRASPGTTSPQALVPASAGTVVGAQRARRCGTSRPAGRRGCSGDGLGTSADPAAASPRRFCSLYQRLITRRRADTGRSRAAGAVLAVDRALGDAGADPAAAGPAGQPVRPRSGGCERPADRGGRGPGAGALVRRRPRRRRHRGNRRRGRRVARRAPQGTARPVPQRPSPTTCRRPRPRSPRPSPRPGTAGLAGDPGAAVLRAGSADPAARS